MESKLLNQSGRLQQVKPTDAVGLELDQVREKKRPDLRDHAFDVKVGEDDLDSFANLSVEEVVTLGVTWIKAWEVWTPESAVGRCRAVKPEGARHR